MFKHKDLTRTMRVIIDKWDNEIQGLERGIHKVKDESKEEYGQRIGELKDHKSALQEEVDAIEEESDKGLEEIEEGLEAAKDAFNATVEKAKNLFENK